MRYYALATDYDGTLASQGRVDDVTLAALERLKRSGRKLIMVTGRELDDLIRVFPRLDLFERVVAENGALLYHPATHEEKSLGPAPPEAFIAALRKRGVDPLFVGRVIVATHEPHETTVLDVIRELGIELQVIFNKGAVMVLPSGINKATGLRVALDELALSSHNVVAVGDAENDHAFLSYCEAGIAVANALPAVKEGADWVTQGSHGAGVAELIDRMIATDLVELAPRLARHEIALGTAGERPVRLKPYGASVMLAGPSGTGKSTFATGLLERMAEHRYQYCIIDPEGDYPNLDGAVALGDSKRVPTVNEVMQLLEKPERNAVVNLLGVSMEHRPAAFESILSALLDLRARTGRPHWIIIDEAHHLLPASWAASLPNLPKKLDGMVLITVHPDQVAQAVLSSIDLLIAIGGAYDETIRRFGKALAEPAPAVPSQSSPPGDAVAWWRQPKGAPFWFQSIPPRGERLRHLRKYAEGELPPERSFFFQGPEGKLNLRAQNLILFMQLADGVDDETWLYHLNRGDYARWFRTFIKDPDLADAAEAIAREKKLAPKESRARIREKIEARYTGSA